MGRINLNFAKLSEADVAKLAEYLMKRPWGEVAEFLNPITSLESEMVAPKEVAPVEEVKA